MEDFSEGGVVSGLYFGPGSPLNWGKDLATLVSKAPNEDPIVIAKETFLCAARLHAHFWNKSEFSNAFWLRGRQWVHGRGRDEWETSMKGAKDGEWH